MRATFAEMNDRVISYTVGAQFSPNALPTPLDLNDHLRRALYLLLA